MDAFHTPRAFFEDSNDKRVGDFKLSQKGSIQKSDLAASIEFFRLPRSDMSQEYRVLSASSSEMRTGTSYEFSSEIKELWWRWDGMWFNSLMSNFLLSLLTKLILT